MIAMSRQYAARNILVASLKVKVTAWPWRKIVSDFFIQSLIFKTISQKWLPY